MSVTTEKDALAARREARRRKILENTDNRLKKIMCVSSEQDDEIPKVESHAKEINIAAPKFIPEDPITRPEVHFIEGTEDGNEPLNFSTDWEPSYLLNQTTPNSKVPDPLVSNHVFHLLILAVSTNLILNSSFSYVIFDNAIYPFFALEMAQLFTRPSQAPSGIVSMVLLLIARNPILSKGINFFGFVSRATNHLIIYIFFVSICIQISQCFN